MTAGDFHCRFHKRIAAGLSAECGSPVRQRSMFLPVTGDDPSGFGLIQFERHFQIAFGGIRTSFYKGKYFKRKSPKRLEPLGPQLATQRLEVQSLNC